MSSGTGEGLRSFAESNGLSYSDTATLPSEGALLGKAGRVEGAATGTLPRGAGGTIAHYVYTTGSGSRREDHWFTIFVGAIPETIGFAPYLGFRSPGSKMPLDDGPKSKRVEPRGAPVEDFWAWAYSGTSDSWLTQLLSPVFVEWLSGSARGFGFELAQGILCVARDGYLTDPGDLEALCKDAAYVATAVGEESREAAEAGLAAGQAAHSLAPDPDVEKTMAAVVGEEAPENIGAKTTELFKYLRRQPDTYFSPSSFLAALLPAAAISAFVLLGDLDSHHGHHQHRHSTSTFFAHGHLAHPHASAFVFVGVVLIFCYLGVLWGRTRSKAKELDRAAFYRGYARSRRLDVEDPLQFAATHAEARLPFEAEWVLSGDLPGGKAGAALAVKGDGKKSKDRIAIVAGPTGPFAWSQLAANPPGLSLRDVDYYVGWLSKQLTAGAAAAG
jgi:hypothetical protein